MTTKVISIFLKTTIYLLVTVKQLSHDGSFCKTDFKRYSYTKKGRELMRYLLNFLLDIDKSYGKIYKSGMTIFWSN